jgi:hypothetical protein
MFVDDVWSVAYQMGNSPHWQVIECQCDESMAAIALTVKIHNSLHHTGFLNSVCPSDERLDVQCE